MDVIFALALLAVCVVLAAVGIEAHNGVMVLLSVALGVCGIVLSAGRLWHAQDAVVQTVGPDRPRVRRRTFGCTLVFCVLAAVGLFVLLLAYLGG